MGAGKTSRAKALGSVLAIIGSTALASSMGSVSSLVLLAAAAVLYSPICERIPILSSEARLQDRIDQQMRGGMELVAELSVSVVPQRLKNGGWRISGGGAPDAWWGKAQTFLDEATNIDARAGKCRTEHPPNDRRSRPRRAHRGPPTASCLAVGRQSLTRTRSLPMLRPSKSSARVSTATSMPPSTIVSS